MSACKIGTKHVKWIVEDKVIKEVYATLGDETESSGKLHFYNKAGSDLMKAKVVHEKDIIRGDSDSVVTPMGIATYHTHPYDCYLTEKVIWGWPSGEDISQVLVWALGGNLIHVVFSAEGPYILEVNPCSVVFLKGLTNVMRGALVHWIMKIGQATHELRSHEVNQKLVGAARGVRPVPPSVAGLSPHDWVDFVNGLTVNNKDARCGLISCEDPTEFQNNRLVQTKISDYLQTLGPVEFYGITAEGEYVRPLIKMEPSEFAKKVASIRSNQHNFACGKKNTNSPDPQWGPGKIFNCKFEPSAPLKAYSKKMARLKRPGIRLHARVKESQIKRIMENYYKNLSNKNPLQPPAVLKVASFPTMTKSCKENSVAQFRKENYELYPKIN